MLCCRGPCSVVVVILQVVVFPVEQQQVQSFIGGFRFVDNSSYALQSLSGAPARPKAVLRRIAPHPPSYCATSPTH